MLDAAGSAISSSSSSSSRSSSSSSEDTGGKADTADTTRPDLLLTHTYVLEICFSEDGADVSNVASKLRPLFQDGDRQLADFAKSCVSRLSSDSRSA